MAKRKKIKVDEHTHIDIKITGFSAHVDSSVNYMVHDTRRCIGYEIIYSFESYLEVEGISTYPETKAGDPFTITIRGSEPQPGDFSLTLDDVHVQNENGTRKYRKARGLEIPVYDVPKGIGWLKRQRGTKSWNGYVWVKPQIITDMLTLLPHITPLFLALHERKVERHRSIVGLTLQTTDPDEE